MNNEIEIRFAASGDAEELLEIYRPYVERSVISFEYEVPSVEEFRSRIEHIREVYPYLVCLAGGKIAGYAYAGRFRERSAFEWDAELSVYVSESFHRSRVGYRLYSVLIELLKLQGVYTAYALITTPNEISERFHERFGFERVMSLEKVGYKFGEWRDLGFYEMELRERCGEPKPIRVVSELDGRLVNGLFEKFSVFRQLI